MPDRVSAPLGLAMSFDTKLKIETEKLRESTIGLLFNGFLLAVGIPQTPGSAIKPLLDAISKIKIEDSAGRNAWSLFSLAIGWSFDTILQRKSIDKSALDGLFKEIIEVIRQEAVNKTAYLEPNFFTNPSGNDLFIKVRNHIVKNRKILRPLTSDSENGIIARLNATFNRGVLEISTRRPDLYNSVHQNLSISSAAVICHLDWQHYKSTVVADFECAALFGQTDTRITASQLFVPLRCHYSITKKAAKGRDEDREFHYEWLHSMLSAWVDAEDDPIRLIGGGPGSGKSTTLRSFAAEMSKSDDNLVIFISLQHVNLDADLRTSIGRLIKDRTAGFIQIDPLSAPALSGISKIIFVFDGLDEIAKPGTAADAVAQTFVHKLNQLLSSSHSRPTSPVIKVLVSGRMPAFQAAKQYLDITDKAALEVIGFSPITSSSNPILRVDQRLEWWSQYADLFSRPASAPPRMTSNDWASLTHEPLLCYLLALSGHLEHEDDSVVIYLNDIYESLINQIWIRGWGDRPSGGNRQGPGKSLTQDDFNYLMETVALAAWRGGDTRVASDSEFRSSLKLTRREDSWDRFERANGPDTANLAMNFYLKSPEDSNRGFEFTHKSFGDYLAARCLWQTALEISKYGTRRIDHALSDWFKITNKCVFTGEIATFLFGEARRTHASIEPNVELIGNIKQLFEHIAAIAMSEGFPAEATSAEGTSAVIDEHLRSEVATWAIISACFRSMRHCGITSPVDMTKYIEKPRLDDFFHRIAARSGTIHENVAVKFLSGIVIHSQSLFGINLFGADLSYSDLRNCNFSWGSFDNCDFYSSNLEQSRFLRSRIEECNFKNANLHHVSFGGAAIHDTNLITGTKGAFVINKATLALMDKASLRRFNTKLAMKRIIRSHDYGQEGDWYDLAPGIDLYERIQSNIPLVKITSR